MALKKGDICAKIIKKIFLQKEEMVILFTELLATLNDEKQDFVSELYNKHKRQIYNTAFYITENHEDSEEIVNAVMIKVIEDVDYFEEKSEREIISLLVVYTKHISIDILRKRNVRLKHLEIEEASEKEQNTDIPDFEYDLEDVVMTNENIQIVRKCLRMLPAKDREIIKMRLVLGYPSKRVAEILNITPNAVDLRFRDAKARLKKLLKGKI